MLFFTGLLRYLPQPVLAAIVLVAVTGLVQVDALRHIWRFSRTRVRRGHGGARRRARLGTPATACCSASCCRLLLLIRRASRPRVIEVGRVPGTSYFADLARHPENERMPDVLVVRSEGSLLYFNVDHVRDRLPALVTRAAAPPRL